jgi:RNA polymerase sporulation-specific sigma factor
MGQEGNIEARNYLVQKNIRLVWSIVQRFLNRGYEQEDLFQIGTIGLIKSIEKFDLSYDVRFSTYAVPMIIGEIQRFIRDDGIVKVSRHLKETANRIRRFKEEYTKKNGIFPAISEISAHLELSPEDIVFALEAVRSPSSIYEKIYENDGDPITLIEQIGEQNGEKWFDELVLNTAIEKLDERERLIISLRYYRDFTQGEVAKRLGISQVQVSRLEKRILEKIKENMQ